MDVMAMRRLKIMLLVVGSLVLAGVLATVVIIIRAGRPGTGTVEKWVGNQIRAIAAGYLNPHWCSRRSTTATHPPS